MTESSTFKFRYAHVLVAILFVSAILIVINYEQVYNGVTGYSLYSETVMTATVKLKDVPTESAPPPSVPPPTLESSPTMEATSTEDPVNKMARELPNVPLRYWDSVRAHAARLGWPDQNACARLPWIEHLQFSNVYWQTQTTPNATYNLLNAYYDDRVLNDGPVVRIISMINDPDPAKVFCQFWFDGVVKPVIVLSEEHYLMWHWGKQKPGVFHPYLITCRLPANTTSVPEAVAVAANSCDAVGNLLRVVYDPPPSDVGRKKFAVCVKGLDFPDFDIAPRLAEWLELVTLLGADLVVMYRLQVHPNVDRVLNHYAARGVVRIVPSTLAGGMPNYPLLQHEYLKSHWISNVFNEVVELNDCFYRNLHSHEYVAILDTDEVIMPLGELRSWSALLNAVHAENTTKASFNGRNIYFFDTHMAGRTLQPGIPSYMHILQHVMRANNFRALGEATKSFFRTDRVIAVHNHYPLYCFDKNDWCDNLELDVNLAQMAHYKVKCTTSMVTQEICDDFNNNVVNDTAVWRFKDKLIAGVQETLKATGLTYT